MSSDMAEGWSQTTLGSLSVVKARIGWRGLAAKEYTDAGPFLIAGKHIQAGEIDWNSCDHINDERYEESPEIILRVGDVIFSKDGSIGNPALIRALPGRATINGTMMMLRPDPGQIDSEFLFQFVSGPTFARMIGEKISGSSIPHIFQRDIIHFPTVLPALDEQRRIAAVLRSVDDQAGLTRKTLEATKATKNGVLIAAFHANSWPHVRVADLLADKRAPMRSGPFGSALLKSELTETGIPLLGIDNVHAERFVPKYRRFISEAKYQELARYTVFPNDVMVTIMGTVGRCCVVPECVGRAISSKHVWTLTLDDARYSSTLLAWLINHEPRVLEQLSGSAQGGIMSAISSETLRNLRVPKPPRPEMLELEQLIASANSTIFLLEEELAGLARLKRLVSGDLLSGRVGVPA